MQTAHAVEHLPREMRVIPEPHEKS
jgi:hypothetical protein